MADPGTPFSQPGGRSGRCRQSPGQEQRQASRHRASDDGEFADIRHSERHAHHRHHARATAGQDGCRGLATDRRHAPGQRRRHLEPFSRPLPAQPLRRRDRPDGHHDHRGRQEAGPQGTLPVAEAVTQRRQRPVLVRPARRGPRTQRHPPRRLATGADRAHRRGRRQPRRQEAAARGRGRRPHRQRGRGGQPQGRRQPGQDPLLRPHAAHVGLVGLRRSGRRSPVEAGGNTGQAVRPGRGHRNAVQHRRPRHRGHGPEDRHDGGHQGHPARPRRRAPRPGNGPLVHRPGLEPDPRQRQPGLGAGPGGLPRYERIQRNPVRAGQTRHRLLRLYRGQPAVRQGGALPGLLPDRHGLPAPRQRGHQRDVLRDRRRLLQPEHRHPDGPVLHRLHRQPDQLEPAALRKGLPHGRLQQGRHDQHVGVGRHSVRRQGPGQERGREQVAYRHPRPRP